MENTLKNKAQFFALYYRQDVYCNKNLKNCTLVYDCLIYPEKTEYLELTSLSQITDKDALWLGKNVNQYCDSYQDDLKYCKDLTERMQRNNHLINSEQADYLRSKGYALPWMDLSIEDLIEYGWIKLKE